jgi:hypothetical protein
MASSALDGLPKQFVASMKTLFDVMDDRNTGFVKLIGNHLCKPEFVCMALSGLALYVFVVAKA